jgi:hypothetical protein
MRRREISARLERHMERGEELMELNGAVLDRHERLIEANRRMLEECKLFIRDMNRRNEKVVQALVRQSEEAGKQQARRVGAIVGGLEDLTEESRAQREGLLAAIDRLPPPQGS